MARNDKTDPPLDAVGVSRESIIVPLDAALKRQFLAQARARDRSGAQLIRDLMRAFVHQQQGAKHDALFCEQVWIGPAFGATGEMVARDAPIEVKAPPPETPRGLLAAPALPPHVRHYSTFEAATLFRVKPGTLRRSLCRDGHYLRVVPIKAANSRLLWPREQVDRVIYGEA